LVKKSLICDWVKIVDSLIGQHVGFLNGRNPCSLISRDVGFLIGEPSLLTAWSSCWSSDWFENPCSLIENPRVQSEHLSLIGTSWLRDIRID
jgi:hypothetical protein